MDSQLKIARVVTVPFFLDNQLREQIKYLVDSGADVTAVASEQGDWSRMKAIDGLTCTPINIARQPSPINDLISLVKLYRLFKAGSFDIVHSATPKAGLLCAIAAKLANVPVRLHTFTGQVWVEKRGVTRKLFRFIDKVILKLNSQCYADSRGQQQFLISQGIGCNNSIKVIGSGSLSGVDLERFNIIPWQEQQASIQSELGIKEGDFVVTFIGRISREKGVVELVSAFKCLQKKYERLHLILIGPCEEKSVEAELIYWADIHRLHYIGSTKKPEKYLAVSNLLCLPSYREGFGTVVIEAAAMKVPTLGTKIYGLIDAIQDEVTGILIEPRNIKQLKIAIEKLIHNRDYCKQLGEQAFIRCQTEFDCKKVSQWVNDEYKTLLGKNSP